MRCANNHSPGGDVILSIESSLQRRISTAVARYYSSIAARATRQAREEWQNRAVRSSETLKPRTDRPRVHVTAAMCTRPYKPRPKWPRDRGAETKAELSMGPFCMTRPNPILTLLSLANIITLLLLLTSFRYLSDKIKFN